MSETYQLEILTPLGRAFSGEVLHTLIPAEDGFVGILRNHTTYLASSAGGRLEVRVPSGEIRKFQVGPGFFQINHNEACFLAESVKTESL